MRRHAFMIMTALSMAAGNAAAAKSCKLSCNESSGACRTSLNETVSTSDKAVVLPDCESRDRKALSDMVVWYPRNNRLANKLVAKGGVIADLIADGDSDCMGWRCLFVSNRRSVSGYNPMGTADRSEGSSSLGAAAGLPYGQVLVPNEGLVLRAVGQAEGADGQLELSGGSASSAFTMRRGTVSIPAEALLPGKQYAYTLKTGAGSEATGDFWVASRDMAQRVDQAADRQLQSMIPTTSNKLLARVMALTAFNLRWDAARLFQEER